MKKFADRVFLASFFLVITQEGSLKLRGFYGVCPQEAGISEEGLTIFADHPAAESIRSDSFVCNESCEITNSSIKVSMIAWPVHSESRIIGSLVAMTDKSCDGSAESKECFESLALLINNALILSLENDSAQIGSLTADRNGTLSADENSKVNGHNPAIPDHLSERQNVILRLISEGRTNGDIAEILGYSESLIRQETIRIYAFLGCSGRQEAAKIFRTSMANNAN